MLFFTIYILQFYIFPHKNCDESIVFSLFSKESETHNTVIFTFQKIYLKFADLLVYFREKKFRILSKWSQKYTALMTYFEKSTSTVWFWWTIIAVFLFDYWKISSSRDFFLGGVGQGGRETFLTFLFTYCLSEGSRAQILRHRYMANFDVIFPKITNISPFTSGILVQIIHKYLVFITIIS